MYVAYKRLFRSINTHRLKVGGWKKVFHANGQKSKVGVVIIILEKCVYQLLSHIRLFATPWTIEHQAPPSMGFSRQEYWSGLSFPSPGDLPVPGIKPRSSTLRADSLPSDPAGKFEGELNQIQFSFQLNPKHPKIYITVLGLTMRSLYANSFQHVFGQMHFKFSII